jgi:hypothetical protein
MSSKFLPNAARSAEGMAGREVFRWRADYKTRQTLLNLVFRNLKINLTTENRSRGFFGLTSTREKAVAIQS